VEVSRQEANRGACPRPLRPKLNPRRLEDRRVVGEPVRGSKALRGGVPVPAVLRLQRLDLAIARVLTKSHTGKLGIGPQRGQHRPLHTLTVRPRVRERVHLGGVQGARPQDTNSDKLLAEAARPPRQTVDVTGKERCEDRLLAASSRRCRAPRSASGGMKLSTLFATATSNAPLGQLIAAALPQTKCAAG